MTIFTDIQKQHENLLRQIKTADEKIQLLDTIDQHLKNVVESELLGRFHLQKWAALSTTQIGRPYS